MYKVYNKLRWKGFLPATFKPLLIFPTSIRYLIVPSYPTLFYVIIRKSNFLIVPMKWFNYMTYLNTISTVFCKQKESYHKKQQI